MNDTFAIEKIVTHYFADIDLKNFEISEFETLFASDAVSERPNGNQTIGPKEIALSAAKSFTRFESTQHLTSGFLVTELGSIHATYRVNLVAMHLWADGFGDDNVDKKDNYFLAGGVVSGSMVKVGDEWRIQSIRNDIVWRQGAGFDQMLMTK